MLRSIFRNNGLSLVLLLLFLLCLIGQFVSGHSSHNSERLSHGLAALDFSQYLVSGHFLGALFENWESEFLQMAAFVALTVVLFQRGSAESKDPDSSSTDDTATGKRKPKDAPWPVRRKGIVLFIYSYSLTIALLLLFAISFLLHAAGGARNHNELAQMHAEPEMSTLDFLTTSEFWFESYQNWQSEFLSIAVMVVFTIFLRQKGSPESKPVAAPHSQTGAQ